MFIEASLADGVAYGFKGGPQFSTTVVPLDSGREQRNINWARGKHRYTAPYQNTTLANYLELKRMFQACYGMGYGFRFKDWSDFQASNEAFGTGDGTTAIFQLYKTSVAGASTYFRKIVKPVSSGFVAMVNGTPVSATVDTTTGLVTFAVAPAAAAILTWSGTFDVPVRFNTDYFPFSMDEYNAMTGDIELVEDTEA